MRLLAIMRSSNLQVTQVVDLRRVARSVRLISKSIVINTCSLHVTSRVNDKGKGSLWKCARIVSYACPEDNRGVV